MERLIKKLEENNVKYKVCNKNTKHINIYFNGKVVISYYGTTGTIYSPYVEIREYQGEDMVMYLYNTIFNNKYVNDVLIKQIEGQQEQINYLRRSVERKEEQFIQEQHENIDLVTIIQKTKFIIDDMYKNTKFWHKKEYLKLMDKIEELKEECGYYDA